MTENLRRDMTKRLFVLFIAYLGSIIAFPLKADNIRSYDFSSVANWVTEQNGTIHPNTGTSALIKEIFDTKTGDCFSGKNDVYFSDGYLMLKPNASLKIPCNSDWTINKVILHSHIGLATDVKVSIYTSHDGNTKASTILTWSKDADHEYEITEKHKTSALYIRTSNSKNARITNITIEYTSTNSSPILAPTFNPGSSTFSSETLVVNISATEKHDIYYTTDGSMPSYTNANIYNGIKGNVATIYASSSPITLQAIAVNPTTGECSDVSSATYEYLSPTDPEEPTEPQEPQEPTEPNDGSKSKPYTVAEIWDMTASSTQQGQWIRGTIYGTISNDNELMPNGVVKTNLVIGDATKYVPIQLPDEDIRKNINLKEHPYLLGKELLIKGNIEKYQNKLGLVSPTTYEISYSVAINSYGYASLYLDMAAEVPSSCTAYYCTTEGNEVYLHPVGEIIPDSTGVIIISDEHNSTCTLTYTIEKNSNEERILAENQLVGYAKDTAVDEDGYAYYALNAKDKQVGFYIPQTAKDQTDASAGFTAKAYKAYLQVPEENKTVAFVIPHRDDETDIAPITQTPEKSVYDLQGRVVNNPTRGIYIQGGRKIIFK